MSRTCARSTHVVVGTLLLLMAAPAGAMPAPGSEGPTDPTVSANTGAATFRIPIAVPPGSGGFAPNLALSYSSRRGDGPFGVGWSLGLPEVHCSARFGAPDFANCDHYELADTLLVHAGSETIGGVSVERYHTFVESFQRISFNDGTNVWLVEQPGGTKLHFGGPPSHVIFQDGAPARWLLERMVDAFGNTIYFDYDRSDVGNAYPKTITYGAGADRGSGPRKVEFTYVDRPDPRLLFTGGIEHQLTQRLAQVTAFSNSGVFRRYLFTYAAPGEYSTDRSRLASVQEFGADCNANFPPSCEDGLPPRTFTYRDVPENAFPSSQWTADDPAYHAPLGSYKSEGWPATAPLVRNRFQVLIGDLDADGLPDRIEILNPDPLSFPTAESPRVLINTGSGFESSSSVGSLAWAFQESFRNLTYTKPYWEFKQVPAPIYDDDPSSIAESAGWNSGGTMYGMCSATLMHRSATLSEELMARGPWASAGSVADLNADGTGHFEPLPSVRMADLDSDGRADLIVSYRLSGVTLHHNCSGQPIPADEKSGETITQVFRNFGGGWAPDATLADDLPPFEEAVVKSTYQTEYDEPSTRWFRFQPDN